MVCRSLGKIVFFSFITHWRSGVNSTLKGVSSTPWGNFFLCNPRGSCFVPWTLRGVLHDILGKSVICNLLGIWFTVLTHKGVSLVISDLLRDVRNPFN